MTAQPPPSVPEHFPLKRTSGLAIGSLVCGIVAFLIPVIPSLVAILCGHAARSKIKRSNGVLVGNGVALAGLICGYASIIILTSAVTFIIYQVKESKRIAQEEIAEEIRRGEEIYRLVMEYESEHGKFPEKLSELVSEGYIESLDGLQPVRGGHWTYFQGLTSKSSSYKYIIRSQHHKVVIFTDGSSGDRNLSYTFEPTDAPMRDHTSVQE